MDFVGTYDPTIENKKFTFYWTQGTDSRLYLESLAISKESHRHLSNSQCWMNLWLCQWFPFRFNPWSKSSYDITLPITEARRWKEPIWCSLACNQWLDLLQCHGEVQLSLLHHMWPPPCSLLSLPATRTAMSGKKSVLEKWKTATNESPKV
jgi:hypothetical protein